MPSDFDDVVREFAAPTLAEHFGERAESGELALVTWARVNSPPVDFTAVLMRRRVEDEDSEGEFTTRKKVERMDADLFVASTEEARSITVLHGEWTVEGTGDVPWKLESVQTTHDAIVRVTLARPWRRRIEKGGLER